MKAEKAPLEILSLTGLRDYGPVRELQWELVEKRARDEIPDTVVFVEHAPVVTRGRGLQWTGQPRERAVPLLPLPPGVAYFEIERGGDLTYHGPGQLVIYPIVKLDGRGFGPKRDVAEYLRRLEQVLIGVLATYGVKAGIKPAATGVWVGDGARKIASIGIAVRKWVTFHGIGLNVSNDLAAFQLISPCGFAPEVMTRLQDWVAPAGSASQDLPSPGQIPPAWRQELEFRFEVGFRESILASSTGSDTPGRD